MKVAPLKHRNGSNDVVAVSCKICKVEILIVVDSLT